MSIVRFRSGRQIGPRKKEMITEQIPRTHSLNILEQERSDRLTKPTETIQYKSLGC
jgi:hypothetical protein